MNTEKKKIAAISAAISAYTKEGSETGIQVQPVCRHTPLSLWGLSGRQDIMRMRSLLQSRALQK